MQWDGNRESDNVADVVATAINAATKIGDDAL